MEKSSKNGGAATSLAATAMAIAGRALRPCDVCGRERAKWYCKADEAFLCEHCDGSVHGANTVALRHERVRLGPNGMLMKNVRRISAAFQHAEDGTKDDPCPPAPVPRHGSRKRPRSCRPHPLLSSSKVKAEPNSPKQDSFKAQNLLLADEFDIKDVQESMHEVPVFVPLLEDFTAQVPGDGNSLGFAVPSAAPDDDTDSGEINEDGLCFSVPVDCDLDRFLDSEADLCDMDSIIAGAIDMDGIADLRGVLDLCDSKDFGGETYGIDFSDVGAFRSSNEASEEEACESPDGSMSEFCGSKVKLEECDELDKIKLEVDEMLGFAFSAGAVKEEEVKQKITLRLNYEDVLKAWSDRGPFWTEGPRPQTVPDDSSFDPASTWDSGLVPEFSMESMQCGEAIGQVPVVNFGEERMSSGGGREARVMRYREKRRTRLFSKKIRYEVRKLNAERRPRLKGRFVKRTLGT